MKTDDFRFLTWKCTKCGRENQSSINGDDKNLYNIIEDKDHCGHCRKEHILIFYPKHINPLK